MNLKKIIKIIFLFLLFTIFHLQLVAQQAPYAAPTKYRYSSDSINSNDTTRTSNFLQEVIIKGKRQSPRENLNQNQSDYKDAYKDGSNDVLTKFGSNNEPKPSFGITGAVDALYKLFSKRGKNARKLQKIILADYQEDEIDNRYTTTLVTSLTGLKGDELKIFMSLYRPAYNFIINASDYDMILFIKKSFQEYRHNAPIK